MLELARFPSAARRGGRLRAARHRLLPARPRRRLPQLLRERTLPGRRRAGARTHRAAGGHAPGAAQRAGGAGRVGPASAWTAINPLWRLRTSQRAGFALGLIVGLLIRPGAGAGGGAVRHRAPVPWSSARCRSAPPSRTRPSRSEPATGTRHAALAARARAPPPAHWCSCGGGGAEPQPPPRPVAAAPPQPVVLPPHAPPAILSARQRAAPSGATPAAADPFLRAGCAFAWRRRRNSSARLAMLGLAKITEREQSGRVVYRARGAYGPFPVEDRCPTTAQESEPCRGVNLVLVRACK